MSPDPNVRDTFINLLGIRILEPMAVLTDLVVSAVCLYCYFQLKKRLPGQPPYIKMYAMFFLLMSLTTFLGGWFGHAFLDRISIYWKLPGWLSSMVAIGFAERAAILRANAYLKPRLGRIISWINILEIIFFITITLITLKFMFVELHVIYGLLIIVFSFETVVYIKSKDKGSRIIQWAIGVAVLMGLVHTLKISFHKWFNFLDFAHIIMAVSLYIIYLGVRKMLVVPDFAIMIDEPLQVVELPAASANNEVKAD